MNHNLHGSHSYFARHPVLEPLEGRALLSGLNVPAALRSGLIQGIEPQGIKTVPSGVAAILGARAAVPGASSST